MQHSPGHAGDSLGSSPCLPSRKPQTPKLSRMTAQPGYVNVALKNRISEWRFKCEVSAQPSSTRDAPEASTAPRRRIPCLRVAAVGSQALAVLVGRRM